MKARGLLIAVSALLVLSGLVYWSNRAEQAKEGQPDPDAPPQILDLAQDQIARVEIRKAGSDATVLEKGESGEWRITAPEPLLADQTAVTSMVGTLSSLASNRLVEEKIEDTAAFGLETPQLEVVVGSADTTKTLRIGDETPTGGNYYAMTDGDQRLFTLASFNKSGLDKTPWDLRDKRLLTFNSDTLSRIELTAKGATTEVGKNNNNEWQILRPRPLRADGGAVEQLVSQLRNARMDADPAGEDMRALAATFARASRVAVAEVTDAAGSQRIEVRKTSGDEYFAESTAVEGVHKIADTVGDALDKGLDDLRNKKLFDFGWSEPQRIEIRDGSESAVYEKTDDKWLRDGREMDSISVRALLDELRDLAATSFPNEGFADAIFEATVIWEGGQRTDHVQVSQTGEQYFARRINEPAIYELSRTDFDAVTDAARNIREPADTTTGGDDSGQ